MHYEKENEKDKFAFHGNAIRCEKVVILAWPIQFKIQCKNLKTHRNYKGFSWKRRKEESCKNFMLLRIYYFFHIPILNTIN